MRLKSGVRVRGIRPELIVALMVAQTVYEENECSAVFTITSCVEGTHSRASLHYTGSAFDLRLPSRAGNILESEDIELVRVMQGRLGPDFDVVLESDHIHIEYQPKGA